MPGGGDWATDVYAAEGTAVKLDVTYQTGTTLTFSWKTTSTTCGQSTGVNVIVDGTTIGWLYFAHLNGAVTSGAITNGMQLGTVHDWVVNGVHCNPGVHVHIEHKNTTNYSCYVDNGQPGVTLNYGANLGVLGSSNTGAQQACSSIPGNTTYISGDYNHDNKPDPDLILANSTGSGYLEDHILNGTNPITWLAHDATVASPVSTADATMLMGDYDRDGYPDLYIIAHDHTGSGKIETYILRGPNFTSWIGGWTSSVQTFPQGDAEYALGKYNHTSGAPDLFIIAHDHTGSGHVETYMLSGSSNYQSLAGGWTTPASVLPSSQVEYTLGDYNSDGYPDLYEVVMNGTGSSKQEIYLINGNGFGSYLTSWVTIAGMVPTTQVRLTMGDYNADSKPDLYEVYLNGTGSSHIEIYTLNGTNFASYVGGWTTPSGTTTTTTAEIAQWASSW